MLVHGRRLIALVSVSTLVVLLLRSKDLSLEGYGSPEVATRSVIKSPSPLNQIFTTADSGSTAYPSYDPDVTSSNVTMLEEEIEEVMMEPLLDVRFWFNNETLFSNVAECAAAPPIVVPQRLPKKADKWVGKFYYYHHYSKFKLTRCIPKIHPHVQLTAESFHSLFIDNGFPVIFSFENMRSLGFRTRASTLKELMERFPWKPDKDPPSKKYHANKNAPSIDLAPGLAAIAAEMRLKHRGGGWHAFPRNVHVKKAALEKLGIERPPVAKKAVIFQAPTVWMGTSTSDTKLHHDCCDNFVYMIAGTKRFTLAPPTDRVNIAPVPCGSLCWATVSHPNRQPAPVLMIGLCDAHNPFFAQCLTCLDLFTKL